MPTVELTTDTDGKIALGSGNVPVFIVIGDSIAAGTLGGMTGEDRTIKEEDWYECTNYAKRLQPGFAATTVAMQLFDQWMYETVAADHVTAWADSTAYVESDIRVYSGQAYRCIQAHTSVLANDRPGTGTNEADYWEDTEFWTATGTSATDQGRVYSQNGDGTGTSALSATLLTCRARAAATFVNSHPYMGTQAERPLPSDINAPVHQADLRDATVLWGMANYLVFNGLFSGTATALPHFIFYGSASSICGQTANAALRRVSWSANYATPAAGDYVDLGAQFNDMYLAPAFADIEATQADSGYFAGIICLLGSNDCTNQANRESSSFHAVCDGGDRPASRVGAELVAITDRIKTALGGIDIPTMYMAPIRTPLAEDGDAANTNRWGSVGLASLRAAIDGDPYASIINVIPYGEENAEQGNDGVHLSPTGASRFGMRLMDRYVDAFVDQPTPLSISTGTQPALLTP